MSFSGNDALLNTHTFSKDLPTPFLIGWLCWLYSQCLTKLLTHTVALVMSVFINCRFVDSDFFCLSSRRAARSGGGAEAGNRYYITSPETLWQCRCRRSSRRPGKKLKRSSEERWNPVSCQSVYILIWVTQLWLWSPHGVSQIFKKKTNVMLC